MLWNKYKDSKQTIVRFSLMIAKQEQGGSRAECVSTDR